MQPITARAYRSVSWGDKAARLFLAVTLILPLLFLARPSTTSNKAQPALLTLADERPGETIGVIVQKVGDSVAAETLVAELGGEITKDLHIINAFAAELSARAVMKLATSPAVRWISLDGPVEDSAKPPKDQLPVWPENTYLDTLGVRQVWQMGYRGQGVGVAVIDSGVSRAKDLQVDPTEAKPESRVIEQLTFNSKANESSDVTGHGTHIAGIVGGSGWVSDYMYAGVAPEVSLFSLKVSDDEGMAYESDVVSAMQWVYDNKDSYNIRVVNLSLNSTVTSSYHNSPMDAAAEILWFNGVVVVTSAGNFDLNPSDNTIQAAPANDPFVITVGATDENGTALRIDDSVSDFSASGLTLDGQKKPEIYAPGKDIVSILADSSNWDVTYPERSVMDGEYFRLSGTSMSAPMVTGAVALMLQADPSLTPDRVKFRLMNSGSTIPGAFGDPNSYPYLDVQAAMTSTSTESANTGIAASQLLWTGEDPVAWDSVSWNSVSWNSVSWNSVSWNSVSWNSVSWNSVSWNE